ncbi:hypothetical protein DICPUDRAFT_79367 [Dictyostelium purpureum]|uniref:Ribosomal protein L22 n=1 Tax=Dictyostelium purpureum TaxID=5786 RepID=F0ZMD4_DICPU|nr:uncharacterized protein DICPUDRAFT_79367 [Dictyostelium purpureum]EGC34897.1 hypothetical protein DICPUDRAFT_79367 [Dictyostelium purpureum]|eukprot:XP_003288589.1 hypothetical protein DICPUDRAFT_79367 [Dictyostelium purpureum]
MNHLIRSISNVSLRNTTNKLYIAPRVFGNNNRGFVTISNNKLFEDKNNTLNIRNNSTSNIFSQAIKTTQEIEQKKLLEEKEDKKEKTIKIDINNNENTVTITLKKLTYSQWKLQALFKAIRGLSYKEAIAQLSFCTKKPSKIIRGLIQQAAHIAETKKNMDPDRLIVNQIWLGHAFYVKSYLFQGRGHAGVVRKPRCHVTVQVKEVPFVEGEKKLGKFGKKHITYEKYNGTFQK